MGAGGRWFKCHNPTSHFAVSARRGLTITAVLGDAEFGNVTAVRAAAFLAAVVRVGDFVDSGRLRAPTAAATADTSARPKRPRTRPRLLDGSPVIAVRAVARGLPAAWRRCRGATGNSRAGTLALPPPCHTRPRLARACPDTGRLVAVRRGSRSGRRIKDDFVPAPHAVAGAGRAHPSALGDRAPGPRTTSSRASSGSIIFEGRSYPGWHHQVVLSAAAHAYISRERMRREPDVSARAPGRAGNLHRAVFARNRCMRQMEQAKHKRPLRI